MSIIIVGSFSIPNGECPPHGMTSAIFFLAGLHPPDHGLDRPRTHGKFTGLSHAVEMHERYIAKRYGKSGACPKEEHPPVNI
jgi:hypothetical protein